MIDRATHKVIGWQTADHMRTCLVINALEMARTQDQAAKERKVTQSADRIYPSDECVTYCADTESPSRLAR